MEKMKSALEIAMEKSKNLKTGANADLDLEQQKYIKASISQGKSFLQGKIKKEEVGEKIMRYPEQYRETALKAFLGHITSEMNLLNTPQILEAIAFLKKDEKTRKACADAQKVYNDFKEQLKIKTAELQESAGNLQKEKLAKKGIKGSAIAGFNIKQLEEWKKMLTEAHEEYQKIVEGFRRAII